MQANPTEIAIAGITYQPKWYKGKLLSIKHTDKIRGDLILGSVKYATNKGYRVVLVDGGSAKTLLKELKAYPNVKIISVKRPSRSPNRRRAIFVSSMIKGIKAIVMTEIEKDSLIKNCIDDIVRPIFEDDADMVIPKREIGLFRRTYPDYMFESETEGNFLYNEELKSEGFLPANHEDLDLFFGARVFKNDKKLLKELFAKYKSNTFDSLNAHKLFDLEEYSDGQFFPVVLALKKKKKIVSVTIPFEYPELQKRNENHGERELFILKRKFQKLTIIVELMHFLGYLDKKRSRKIRRVL